MECQKLVDVLNEDFARALDSVVHSKLLYKIHKIGITGKLYNWIADSLEGWIQRTFVEHEYSSTSQLVSSVIQGSCLGPLLFIYFIY